jgi:hypothetical protein
VKEILKVRFEKIRGKFRRKSVMRLQPRVGNVCPSSFSKRRATNKKRKKDGQSLGLSVSVEEKFSLAFP